MCKINRLELKKGKKNKQLLEYSLKNKINYQYIGLKKFKCIFWKFPFYSDYLLLNVLRVKAHKLSLYTVAFQVLHAKEAIPQKYNFLSF